MPASRLRPWLIVPGELPSRSIEKLPAAGWCGLAVDQVDRAAGDGPITDRAAGADRAERRVARGFAEAAVVDEVGVRVRSSGERQEQRAGDGRLEIEHREPLVEQLEQIVSSEVRLAGVTARARWEDVTSCTAFRSGA